MKFDTNRYKVYTWKNWTMLHWILNPGLAFNEIILGQRLPKISLEDKTSDKPRIERSHIPCPHCHTLHDGRTWSGPNGTAFKNWFGLYCRQCGGIIPCLTNLTSRLILIVAAPIWFWFKDALKKKWLKAQPARFEDIDIESSVNPFDGKGWIVQGLSWSAFMYIFMTLLYPFISGDKITVSSMLFGIPLWAAMGLAFGYTMKKILGMKGKRSASIKDAE